MRLRWLRQALLDLEEIETYIAEESPTVAVNIVIKIIKAVSLLRDQCGIGRIGRVPGTKELIVPSNIFRGHNTISLAIIILIKDIYGADSTLS